MPYLTESLAVAGRILIELGRQRRSLLFWSVFPVSILLLIGTILTGRTGLAFDAALNQAAASALVGAGFFFSALGGTVAILVSEREQGTLRRLFLSPLRGLSYWLGICLAQGTIGLGQTILVYGVGAIWGARFQGSWLLGGLVLVLSLMGYVGMGFILGSLLGRRTEDVNALVATFGLPLVILGGAFLPTSLFPQSLLDWAKYDPVYHMNEALLAVGAEGEGWSAIENHLRFLVGFTVLAVAGGVLAYRHMLRRERYL